MNLDNKKLKIIFGLCFLFLIFNFSFSQAQENDLFLVVSPSSPSPGQSYSVEAKSFQFDTTRAYFEWFRDGRKIDEGTGVIKKTFAGEKLGAQTTIGVVSAENSASANIGINDIDFVVNPLTYVPPFYRGASLPTPGSIVEVYAVPHLFSGASRISSPNLLFEWKLDDKLIQEQSGRGKNKLIFFLPKTPLGVNEVALAVSSLNGAMAHEKRTAIEMRRSEIILYRSSSLLGKSALAISSFEAKSGEEFSVAAEPFFFDLNSLLRSAVSWLANGARISKGNEQNPFLLELSSQPGTESENNISFKIEDGENVFQKAEGKITIKIKD